MIRITLWAVPRRWAAVFFLVLSAATCARAADPIARVESTPREIQFIGWDTEGGKQADTNLLRTNSPAVIQIKEADKWVPAADRATLRVTTDKAGGFDLQIIGQDAKQPMRLFVPFNPCASAITVLPSRIDGEAFHFPAVLSAPGSGQMRVDSADESDITCTLDGSRARKIVDWIIDLPVHDGKVDLKLQFRPAILPAPAGLADQAMWKLARRGWFNVFQVSARWGDGGNPFSAPSGVLANNVISDPVSICLFIYADSALWTPTLADGVSATASVRHTLEWWLQKRMLASGEVPGYWNLNDFLDASPSMLISAWDCVEATNDNAWLAGIIPALEKTAEFQAARDLDNSGLVQAVQSGNAGTLKQPGRSCSAYDAVNCGGKDAYCNILTYRAFRCMADMERRLGRQEQKSRYTKLADRLKDAFAKTLYNPATGWIAQWKSRDGQIHDYGCTFVNGLAIEYGLVDPETGKQILGRLRDKMASDGLKRHDLGVPMTLIPVHRSDYLLPDAPGLPQREDGTDTFQYYLNGAITTGDSLRYITACYCVGQTEWGDEFLMPMLERLQKGTFENGGFACNVVDSYPGGAEFLTWDAKPCGYEGLLSHSYHWLQAVVLREKAFRDRIHRPLEAR